jgi:hypothetical protein
MNLLPDELILEILENVARLYRPSIRLEVYTPRAHNLHPLTLVSRTLNRVATPLLYESIGAAHFRTYQCWNDIVTSLKLNPSLGHYIKHIQTSRFYITRANPAPSDLRPVLPFDLVSANNRERSRESEQKPKHVQDNVLVTYLILRTPNLQTLEVLGLRRGSSKARLKLLPLVVEELGRIIYTDLDAGTIPRRFESLRTLRLDMIEWSWCPAGAALPFLELPRLKSLTLRSWGGEETREEERCNIYGVQRGWPLRSSPVEEICLDMVKAKHRMVSLTQR